MGFFKRHPTVFMGLIITILFLGFWLFRIEFLDTLDLKFYDLLMKLRSDSRRTSEVVLVDIDDKSIEKLGRKELIQLKETFSKEVLDKAGEYGQAFLRALDEAQSKLDHDKSLADAIKESGKVVLPVFLKKSRRVAGKTAVSDKALINQSIQNIRSPAGARYPRSNTIGLPIPVLLTNAKGIGHINLFFDSDGTVRRDQPVYEYNGIFIPSYTIKLAALYLNVPNNKIRAELGSAIYLGPLKIPITLRSEILVSFKGATGSFKRYSFFDVINDKVPKRVFKNKIALVSPSAAGIMNPLSTPTDATMPVGEFSAHALWSILNNNSMQQPSWGYRAELLMILIIGLLIMIILPRLKALPAGMAFISLLILLVGGSAYFFVSQGLWVQVTYPLILLILGYIGVTSLNYFATETRKEKVEIESAATNRMLGLSFQSQGLLDMAWDKLRRVPIDEEMKGILYNLALDYERKRQINKAAVIYEYIEANDKCFRDVVEKKNKLMHVSETMVFGDGFLSSTSAGEDLLATATGTRPTLGRYELIKQLGKGAMGSVYLGQDPRINRTTAIKTFRFGDEFDPEEIRALKDKFFREAESAGTLSHPNIVTIFDAGDEHDLAYIAMEYLEGEDLVKYTKKNYLLPMLKVIDYAADIADALDYAHQKGIVHRDIKPANIMLLKSGIVKITDFGVARITATSKTQTGMIKGTPYYMSPEQFSGKKVDGRSDIFSLGVMLFQLLTGELPFTGENSAALMHQIINARHPNPKTINPKIFAPLVTIIDNALEKEREKRYQRVSRMRDHLRAVRRRVDAVIAKNRAKKASA
jgi:serine/threonine-protein kinase